MAILLPVNNTGDRIFSIILGKHMIKIRTYFNRVIGYWLADFYVEMDKPILLGATLKTGNNILGIKSSLERQYGHIHMTNSAQGVSSLGTTAQMVWLSNQEVKKSQN